jgi:F-type H+-transporting ATPase subunit a
MLVLAPLILVIELISHCVRPISLALRLFGNMVGDHMVLGIFLGLVPWIVPIPIMVLGTIVCVVQTLVFCLLSVVYISLAIEDLSHAHDDHAGEAHAH